MLDAESISPASAAYSRTKTISLSLRDKTSVAKVQYDAVSRARGISSLSSSSVPDRLCEITFRVSMIVSAPVLKESSRDITYCFDERFIVADCCAF